MDSFEFNKVAMAFLGVVFIVMGLNFVSESLFHIDQPETKGYAIEVAEASTSGAAPADDGPKFDPVTPLLASADVGAGESSIKACVACHTFDEGGGNKVGPALYDIVNKAIAGDSEFKYSKALVDYGVDKTWTYEELNGFLWKPKTFVKGTKMGFAGVKKVEDRANIIAYLRSLSGSPAPLPAE